MNILLIGNINSPFLLDYANQLFERSSHQIHLLSLNKVSDYAKSTCKVANLIELDIKPSRIPFATILKQAFETKKKISGLKIKIDVIHIHYVHFFYFLLSRFLQRSSQKLILSFWGGDVHFFGNMKFVLLKKLRATATHVSVASNSYKDKLIQRDLSVANKLSICKFGLSTLNEIDQVSKQDQIDFITKYTLPHGKPYVMLGTNAHEGQQHINVLKSLEELKSNVHLLVPLTYSRSESYISQLLEQLEASQHSFTCFHQFLSNKELATLTCVIDILIQVQLQDQFSAIMNEHLYSGSRLITGAWLNYSELDELNVDYQKISELNRISKAVLAELNQFELIENSNKSKIWQLCSWEYNLPKWLHLYN